MQIRHISKGKTNFIGFIFFSLEIVTSQLAVFYFKPKHSGRCHPENRVISGCARSQPADLTFILFSYKLVY